MYTKPHILYWKWNNDLLNKEILRERTMDIINRSMFDVIYVSLHSVTEENQIASNPEMVESIRECAGILKQHGRKMVLDLAVYYEKEYIRKNPINEKSYLTKYCCGTLDENGCYSEQFKQADGVFLCKCLDFDKDGLFDENTVIDIADKVCVENNTVTINAGTALGGRSFVFYVYKNKDRYDILGDEYKEKWVNICKYVADTPISGIAADEWGVNPALEALSGDIVSTDDIADIVFEGKEDLNRVKFFIEWFVVTDGLFKYYKKMFDSDLKSDLLYFRNSSADKEKGICIVNQYLEVLRKRVVDGEQFLYDMSKKYFGEDSIVLCHPTWWGDELDSNLDIPRNGLDWWEVKKDFAQTDELILMPVRMARTRRCPENLWYNMWYSMRTLDIKTYFRETWINARYGGRTHYLGYECYEPGVVLCLNQKDYLEKCSETEEKIEILNPLQTSRPDSRILMIFGYEAVANWKIADPAETKWNRISANIHNAWKFTKELFDSHYLCELIPSTEIGNGFVDIKDDKISYCGHTYDMLIYIMPEGADKITKELIQRYANVNENLIIVGNTVDFMKGVGLLNTSKTDVEPVLPVLERQGIKRNCGENYCVYEDGSVVFTTDGEKNVGNALKIDQEVCGMKVKFDGEDFLYIKPENDRYTTAFGNCNFIEII